MITDSLPYLLQLIKSNIILHTLVVHGSWHHINLGKYEHQVMGQTLIIKDFPLSHADKFEVNFSVQDDIFSGTTGKMTALSLITREPKYFDSSGFYFDDDENRGKNKNPLVKAERKHSKDLGVFRIYDDAISPAFVAITKNANYGYMIYIRFYTKFDAAYKIKTQVDEALEKSANWF